MPRIDHKINLNSMCRTGDPKYMHCTVARNPEGVVVRASLECAGIPHTCNGCGEVLLLKKDKEFYYWTHAPAHIDCPLYKGRAGKDAQ